MDLLSRISARAEQLRSTRITATDTVSGVTSSFFITDNLAPDFASADPYRGAMGIPGAWRATVLLSDLLGEVPWDAWRTVAGGPEECIDPKPPLLEQPAPPDTRMTTFSSLALDLIWHGNALAVIAARNFAGWPTAILPVPAQSVAVRRVTPFVDSPLPVGALEYSIGSMSLGSSDVIHIKGPCQPGAVRGLGVLEAHFSTLNLARDQQRQAASVSVHGVPTGILESANPDLTDDEAADMKAKWLAAQSTRSIAVLNASTKFTPLSWNPEQLQLVEARKMTINELELIFGLPVGWLGGMNSARQYSNIEQDAVNLIKFSLGGHLARFEQTFSLAFPRGTVARANLDAVLRADTLTRYQAHALGIQSGFLTVDEAREYEHRPPLGDKPELMPDAYVYDALTGDQTDTATRAAGHDVTPGHDQLHHYWVWGKGRAKWETWTELYHHLLKYMNPEMAKRAASKWFEERHGYAAGSDLNKVAHGKPPRGHKVGPG